MKSVLTSNPINCHCVSGVFSPKTRGAYLAQILIAVELFPDPAAAVDEGAAAADEEASVAVAEADALSVVPAACAETSVGILAAVASRSVAAKPRVVRRPVILDDDERLLVQLTILTGRRSRFLEQ